MVLFTFCCGFATGVALITVKLVRRAGWKDTGILLDYLFTGRIKEAFKYADHLYYKHRK
jgi:hypothetical protein